ncbi:CO or xanthine dehydrogenase, FAD-binding subunit [Proteiniborus ethanoligenes]|uniref:CO or xanthine dehydrogenase, FAD-binding subunit n=1 Tax=Proteiniborus ethanoligenes TaxID=415015 RepID=A0A1H3MCQ0_9FIRM|nr:FAD binding domain-containing protein [Proteiniborus ethanoligenes]SDY74078.1 CO or xanthine dehydrogenase, FAD-binding subunit [Proteiniborus ethanoligenes]
MLITFGEYIRPKSIEEAYEIFMQKKSATLIGGGCYLRMGNKRLGLAVDLCDAGLDYMEENEGSIEIGAMTTFRKLETSQLLSKYFGNVISESVKHIIGIQLRNIVTIGATVFSKYGFSDPITTLLALNAEILLYNGGKMSLEDYLKEENRRKDILEKIILNKNVEKAAFQSMRNSQVDYAILNAAVSRIDGKYRIVVGARPRVSALAYKAMEYINSTEITEESAYRTGEIASEELVFGSNTRGSKEYRKEICKVLVKRAIMEVSKC